MKILRILVCFFIATFTLQAQEEQLHNSQVLNASLTIPSNTQVKPIERKGNKLEVFTFKAEDNKTLFTVVLSQHNELSYSFDDLSTKDFESTYAEQCSCSLESNTLQYYTNFNSYQLKADLSQVGLEVYDYQDYFVKDGKVYSFRYSVPINEHNSFENQYQELLNSVVF